MFYQEDAAQLSAAFDELRGLTQFEGCVLDLLFARESVTEQLEHLDNAQRNCAEFIGPGEDRWLIINGVAHHLENIDGTITVTKYFEGNQHACH